jgi:hypothetical protein
MQPIESLHEQAGECLRLADAAQSPGQKTLLIGMAHAWLALAEQRERLAAIPQANRQHVSTA